MIVTKAKETIGTIKMVMGEGGPKSTAVVTTQQGHEVGFHVTAEYAQARDLPG